LGVFLGQATAKKKEGRKMPSEAIAGVGTVFNRGDGASNENFTAIAEINQIAGPDMSRAAIDVTNLDSTAGYREFIMGFRDSGLITLTMNWTRDGWDRLRDDFESDASVNWQIVFPDTGNTTFDFAAFVNGMTPNVTPDDKITMVVTMKITGQVTMSS